MKCRYALEARALTYRYPKAAAPAVLDADLTLSRGEVVAVLGPNGAGKSTLLRLLLGFYRPQGGEVRLCPALGVRRKAVAFVPQREQTLFAFRVAEYMLLGRTPHLGFLASPKPEDLAEVALALQKLGIEPLADKPITALSGGEHQLVLIGRALVQKAPILLLDEPTNHLDLGNRYRVLTLLRSLADEGRAVLFTTHDPQSAAVIADRALLMKEGSIIVDAPAKEAITEANLNQLYGAFVRVESVEGFTVVLPRR